MTVKCKSHYDREVEVYIMTGDGSLTMTGKWKYTSENTIYIFPSRK